MMNRLVKGMLTVLLLVTSSCANGFAMENPNYNPDRYTNPVDGFTCPITEALFNAAANLCRDHRGLMVTKAEFDAKKKAYEEEEDRRNQCYNRFFTPLYAIPKWCPNYQSVS